MNDEKMREEFESFVGGNGFFNDFSRSTIHQDVYRRPSVELMWLSWKASRAALEVQSPEDFTDGGIPKARILIAHHREIVARWISAIEATGLKVKP